MIFSQLILWMFLEKPSTALADLSLPKDDYVADYYAAKKCMRNQLIAR